MTLANLTESLLILERPNIFGYLSSTFSGGSDLNLLSTCDATHGWVIWGKVGGATHGWVSGSIQTYFDLVVETSEVKIHFGLWQMVKSFDDVVCICIGPFRARSKTFTLQLVIEHYSLDTLLCSVN